MTQNTGISSPSDNTGQPSQPVKPGKPQKNLYEPYDTPLIIYEALRSFVILVAFFATRLKLIGRHNIPPKGAFILAPNHLSWADIPLVPARIRPKVVYMAKEEYFSGSWAWLIRLLGSFPVRRGEADRQALRAGEEQLKKGYILGIFPEGTRSRTRTMAKAHAGMGMIALRTGVPVVPVAIWGSEYVLKKFRPLVTISYGEPVILKPKGAKITREDIDEATEQVMRRIASMLPPQYRGVYGEELPVQSTAVEDSPD